MPAERDLHTLLDRMDPVLQEGEFVFCSIPADQVGRLTVPYLGLFYEKEGATILWEKKDAEKAGFGFPSEWKMITLSVHSALDAVGFLAAVTGKLASEGIAVNVISAFYHDHLFVSTDQAHRAMEALNLIRKTAEPFVEAKPEIEGYRI
jgi:hypothetical protein